MVCCSVSESYSFITDIKAYFQTIEAFARSTHIAVFDYFQGLVFGVIIFAISINTVVALLLLIYCSILLQPIYLRSLWLNRLIINSNKK